MSLQKKLEDSFRWEVKDRNIGYNEALNFTIKELGVVAQQIREKTDSQEVEKEAILKAVNEDQQMPNASQEIALRSSYWITGYNQALKWVLGLLVENSKQKPRTRCLSCGYDGNEIQGEHPNLYRGYGCPKCHSPLVVIVEQEGEKP